MGGPCRQQGSEFLDGVEDALHIQVHDLAKLVLWVGIKFLPPCCTGVGEEDVEMGGGLGDLGDEPV